MMRKIFIFLTVIFAFTLSSCALDDDSANFHFTALRITDAELPDAFDFGETYRIRFSYVLPDGCTSYEFPDVTQEDTTVRSVVAFGSVRTDAEACTQAIVEGEGFFDFSVIYEQDYTFRFFQGENSEGELEYLEVVVPVN